jgi:Skp family chaperone for outer membrane proteins
MKLFSYLALFFFITVFSTNSYSEQKIVYLDMDKILSNSTAGINATKSLESQLKKKTTEFNKISKKLKEDEAKIISQKNIISKDEYLKKINNLRNQVKEYRKNRKTTFDKITNQRLTLSRNFIDLINPIISDYALQNSISLIIQKKNILVGKSELDITEKILLIVNKKIIKIKN